MTLKICFDNQTHRISKNPSDYSTLLRKVTEIFGNQLPQNWTLQYLDSDDDKIMLNTEEDYRTLLEEEVSESKKSVKIFIFPVEDSQNKSQIQPDLSYAESTEKKNEEIVEKPVMIIEDAESTYIVEPQDLIKNQEINQNAPEDKVEIAEEKPETIQQEKVEPVEEKVIIETVQKDKKEQEKQEKIKEKKRKCQEKKQKAMKQGAEKQARKKKEFQDIIVDLIFEQLPVIASYNRDFIQENSAPKPQAKRNERASAVVHRRIQCDGCGVFPLTGIRYKCLECADFDFCEKCEATKQHPHPFIKFKKPEEERESVDFARNRCPAFGRVNPHHQEGGFPFHHHRPSGFNHGGQRMNEQFRPRNNQQEVRRSHPGFLSFYV